MLTYFLLECSATWAISKRSQKKKLLCHNKELNCQSVFLGGVCA